MIIIRDSKFDPRGLLPMDTLLACPMCNAHTDHLGRPAVEALPAKEVWRHGARKQDRWCLVCGHRWVTVLPPTFAAELNVSAVSWFKVD